MKCWEGTWKGLAAEPWLWLSNPSFLQVPRSISIETWASGGIGAGAVHNLEFWFSCRRWRRGAKGSLPNLWCRCPRFVIKRKFVLMACLFFNLIIITFFSGLISNNPGMIYLHKFSECDHLLSLLRDVCVGNVVLSLNVTVFGAHYWFFCESLESEFAQWLRMHFI